MSPSDRSDGDGNGRRPTRAGRAEHDQPAPAPIERSPRGRIIIRSSSHPPASDVGDRPTEVSGAHRLPHEDAEARAKRDTPAERPRRRRQVEAARSLAIEFGAAFEPKPPAHDGVPRPPNSSTAPSPPAVPSSTTAQRAANAGAATGAREPAVEIRFVSDEPDKPAARLPAVAPNGEPRESRVLASAAVLLAALAVAGLLWRLLLH